ncbi:MAG TPA: response regulator [Euzebya sp.]|nr:response regulator [Euzebya sp.]
MTPNADTLSQTIRTLVVDDEPDVAAIHGAWVARMDGFTLVGTASTVAEALHAVHAVEPDLVLLDVFLPDGSGIDFLRELRASPIGDHVGVIAITAAKEVEHVRAAMAGGVAHYLVKPFSAELFRSRLQDYAERRHELSVRAGDEEVSGQREVDRLIGDRGGRRARRLPKGLSELSMARIVAALGKDDLTAAQAATRSGMSRVAAGRYLNHLEELGAVVAEPLYGTLGRPSLRYHLIRTPTWIAHVDVGAPDRSTAHPRI